MYKVYDTLKYLQNTVIKHKMMVDEACGVDKGDLVIYSIERELI